jgi:hypothetical protein
VDQVEAAVGDRLHGSRQARHADAQARVVGHLELGHRGQPAVDLRIRAEHLDLKALDAARADLLDRARDPVRAADPVGEDRHARCLTVLAARVQLGPLVGEERRRRRIRDRRRAALEQARRGAHHVALAACGRQRLLDRHTQLALVRPAGPAVEI